MTVRGSVTADTAPITGKNTCKTTPVEHNKNFFVRTGYDYELSSGGVMRANRWAEHRRETSAIQYNADQGADQGAATGFAFVARNNDGFINISKWAPSFAMGANGGTYKSFDLRSLYSSHRRYAYHR